MISPFGVEHGYEVSKGLSPNVERGLQAVMRQHHVGSLGEAGRSGSARARYATNRLVRSTANGRKSKAIPNATWQGTFDAAEEGKWAKLAEKNSLGVTNRKKPGRFLP